MNNAIVYFIVCGSLVCFGEGIPAAPQSAPESQYKQKTFYPDIQDSDKNSGEPREEDGKLMQFLQQAKKNQKERYLWSADGAEVNREELIANMDSNAILRQFYHDFTDSSLQTILSQYASFPEAYSYVLADYDFLKAYREFLSALKLYADCTQQDYELAVQGEVKQENPMRFLLQQQIKNLKGEFFRITTPSGMNHVAEMDNNGYFEIRSCEIPEQPEQNLLGDLADWKARWEYGTELLKAFPSMTLYELKRNMSSAARNALVSFQRKKQSGRYLLNIIKRYCILDDGKREKSVTSYTSVIVEVDYQSKNKKYELKPEVLFAAPPVECSLLSYDAETGKSISDESDSMLIWIIFMLHYSDLPNEPVTQGQCWSVDNTRYELIAAGLVQGRLLAKVKGVASLNNNAGYIEGSFLFDLAKGKFISGEYHYLKTTTERDVLFEVTIRSLDE